MRRARLVLLGAVAAVLAAGCGAVAPARPATSVAQPPAQPTASPLPGADGADAAVRAFGKLKARADLTFHVVEKISTTGGAGGGTLTMDVAGSDLSVTVKVPGVSEIEIRHVGAVTFARAGKDPWRSGTADERLLDELADPWLFLCWLDGLEYTGLVDTPEGGLGFACPGEFTYQSGSMRSRGMVGRIESLDLVLTADGEPVRMTLSGVGPTLVSTTETFKATFDFSKVGERIVIKAPRT